MNGKRLIIYLWMTLIFGVAAYAEEIPAVVVDSILPSDTLIAESDTLSDPEWYVAPDAFFSSRVPKRANTPACPIEWVYLYDEDSVVYKGINYGYGDTIRTSVWYFNPDGSSFGESKEEFISDDKDSLLYYARYSWDETINNWKGDLRYEHVYNDSGLVTSNVNYVWINNKWEKNEGYSYLYDTQDREIEYTSYARNANTGVYEPKTHWLRNYDADDNLVLDERYSSYVNGSWVGTSKEEWAYTDGVLTMKAKYGWANGDWKGTLKEVWGYTDEIQTLYEKYTGYSNGNWIGTQKETWEYTSGNLTQHITYGWGTDDWVGSIKEQWTYSNGNLTLHIKQVWSNEAWVGSYKEEWTYTDSKLTLHEQYDWGTNDWSIKLQEKTAYSGSNIILIENYKWENGVKIGTKKEETSYTSGKKTSFIIYAWENGLWVATNNEVWEYTSNNLTLHEQFVWESGSWVGSVKEIWGYTSNKKTSYEKWIRENGAYVGSEKERWEYESKNMTLHEQFAWENGGWVGALMETWGYTSNKKTAYEKLVWENGAYVKSLKEKWAYDGSSQTLYEKYEGQNDVWVGIEKEVWGYTGTYLTLHETYEWYNSDWSVTLREISAFDTDGNQTLIENYTGTNGVIKGVKKEEYTFANTTAGLKKTSTITYTWNATKQAFIGKTWTVSDVDGAGNTIESCKYTYNTTKEAWIGSGNHIFRTYNSDKNITEEIVQSWNNTLVNWLNYSRTTNQYEGKNKTQTVLYKWSTTDNDWIGVNRSDWHFNSAGLNDSIRNYKYTDGQWNEVTRTVKTYDADDNNILTYNAKWNGEKWAMTSMERMDILYDNYGHQSLVAKFSCTADSIWKGVQKDTAAYLTADKLLFRARYTSWANGEWIPSFKMEYQYDEAQRNTLEQRLDWKSNSWVGKYRYEKLYDSEGRELLSATYEDWDATRNDWIGSSKTTTTYYPAGKKENQVLYWWRASDWEPLFSYSYTYDTNGREIEQVVQMYLMQQWISTNKYEKEYKGSTLVKDNEYVWKGGQWVYSSRNELYYDENVQTRLRRELTGSWNSGEVISYEDKHYTYTCDPHYYTIRFVNFDGAVLSSEKVLEGLTPAYTGETPIRSDAEYTYTFAGWTPEIVPASAHATYTATYTKTKNSYTITWLNEDGTEIDKTVVEYGLMPTHADVTKANTAEYTYSFAGWSPGLGIVTGDATYTASFHATKNTYTITWLNDDGSPIDETVVEYGVVPTHADATKASTAEWSYTFAGWSPEVTEVSGDATYTATFTATKNSYTITWLNEDGSLINQMNLNYGEMPTHADATKASTAEWSYTFAGWSPEITEVSGDATYTATFTATKKSYMITFKNGDEVLQSEAVEYGVIPVYEGQTPTKESDAQNTYTFAGWSPEITEVSGEATYNAVFSNSTNSYTITWLNDDGSQIDQMNLNYGEMPTHADATKASTAEWSYTFAGWSPEITEVSGDATYTATFTATKNSYTITWLNEDGSLINQMNLNYGEMPTHADATKASTAEWSYTFAGWSPEITEVSGDATYTATFTATKNSYTITWLNDDGSQINQINLNYGEMPTHADATKASTAEWSYTFAGWSPDVTEVSGDATYTAAFTATKNSYTITWLNDDGSLINQMNLNYGEMPTHADATKASTAEWTYTFAGWSPEITEVSGDATYTATFTATKNSYTVTWLNEDGSLINQMNLNYGEMPTHADATKASTAEWTYTFAGWSPDVTEVSGDATYTATFTATKNSYTVTWLNDDGSLINQMNLNYGELPTHADATKASTAEWSYTFAGWSPEVMEVSGDATYTATFTATKNSYMITFKNGEEILQSTAVEYGTMPTYDGATPIKNADAQYTYAYAGWDSEVVAVTGDATYNAVFSSEVKGYTITWLNEDGSLINQMNLNYGEMPIYDGETPAKDETAQYTYSFAGWSPDVMEVSGDATYTAMFTATKKSYTITFKNGEEILQSTAVEFGTMPTYNGATPIKNADAQYAYTYAGWDREVVSVAGDATYIAVFDSVVRTYTVTFYLENGTTVLERIQVPYGEMPTNSVIPSLSTDNSCTYYSFAGWEPEISPVTGDANYIATYSENRYEHVVTFRNYDYTVLQRSKQPCGLIPTYDGDTPTRPSTAQYSYLFKGWDKQLVELSGDATYTAVYERTVNSYEIVFLDEDGTEFESKEVAYGKMPTCSVIPTKEEDEEYRYIFAAWIPTLQKVTKDATYTASYRAVEKTQEGLDGVWADAPAKKVLIDDTIYIIRAGKTYTLDGMLVR